MAQYLGHDQGTAADAARLVNSNGEQLSPSFPSMHVLMSMNVHASCSAPRQGPKQFPKGYHIADYIEHCTY